MTTLSQSPAQEIRAAAEAVRNAGRRATPGPWTCSPVWSPDATSTSGVYSRAHPTGTVESEVVASGRIRSGYGGVRNPHNAVWITLMQPAVAEPLAVLLDEFAKRWDDEISRDRPEGPCCDGAMPCGHPEEDFHDGGSVSSGCDRVFYGGEDRCDCFDGALALTRVIKAAVDA